MIAAWRQLQRIKQEAMALQEIPVAKLAALVANAAGGKKSGGTFTPAEFLSFQQQREDRAAFPVPVAAVLLALRNEQRIPEWMLCVWDDVLSVADQVGITPKDRALVSDCGSVWMVAPEMEGPGVRGMVFADGPVGGLLWLRDLDRPLLRYQCRLPKARGMGWIEAGVLLPFAAT